MYYVVKVKVSLYMPKRHRGEAEFYKFSTPALEGGGFMCYVEQPNFTNLIRAYKIFVNYVSSSRIKKIVLLHELATQI